MKKKPYAVRFSVTLVVASDSDDLGVIMDEVAALRRKHPHMREAIKEQAGISSVQRIRSDSVLAEDFADYTPYGADDDDTVASMLVNEKTP